MPLIFDQEVRKAVDIFYRSQRSSENALALYAAEKLARDYTSTDCTDLMVQADTCKISPKKALQPFEDVELITQPTWNEFLRQYTAYALAAAMTKIPGVKREQNIRLRLADESYREF